MLTKARRCVEAHPPERYCRPRLADRACHNYIGHNYLGHNYIGHNHLGHNYIGLAYRACHNYIGHNYFGHNYIGLAYRACHLLAEDAMPTHMHMHMPICMSAHMSAHAYLRRGAVAQRRCPRHNIVLALYSYGPI